MSRSQFTFQVQHPTGISDLSNKSDVKLSRDDEAEQQIGQGLRQRCLVQANNTERYTCKRIRKRQNTILLLIFYFNMHNFTVFLNFLLQEMKSFSEKNPKI